jgi:molecular chaperone GrpE (heat shock protein)
MADPAPPTTPNQSLLELIFAVKGLAQTVEFIHSDLRRLIEDESRSRNRELEKIRDLVVKSNQSLSVLPITISDRFESIVRHLEKGTNEKVDGVLEDVRLTLNDVRQKLWYYLREREKEQVVEVIKREVTGAHRAVIEQEHEKKEEVTGSVSLMKDGDLRIQAKFDWKKLKTVLTVAKWAGVTLATGGGVAWLIEFLRSHVR